MKTKINIKHPPYQAENSDQIVFSKSLKNLFLKNCKDGPVLPHCTGYEHKVWTLYAEKISALHYEQQIFHL